MRKKTILFLSLTIVFLSGPATASLQNGQYAVDGTWQEVLAGSPGNQEGVPGNLISAHGSGWWLYNAELSTVTVIGELKYQTIYTGGTLYLYEGTPWLPGLDQSNYISISMGDLTNITQKYSDGSMEFQIGGSGIYGSQHVYITASYNGTPGIGTGLGPDGSTVYSIPMGTLTSANLVVTPIPAAAWLLGSGLIGLVAIRRRMK